MYVTYSVAVVIPTSNRPNETARALESVINQTLQVNEIFIIDDGSSIENVQILESLITESKVTFIRNSSSYHPGRVRKSVANLIKSEWVAFLDSDDYWMPNKLEQQFRIIGETGAKAICSNATVSLDGRLNGSLLSIKEGFKDFSDLKKRNFVITSSVVIEKKVLDTIGFFATSYLVRGAEDYATWLRVSSNFNWYFIDEDLVTYTDNMVDSIRKSDEFPQVFAGVSGILDYASWTISKNRSTQLLLRLYLKFLNLMVR